jgi:glucose-6-phosphate dehydrogenase assembly protein OpcA
MGAVIQPEKILKQLDELWVTLGKQPETGADGVLRACAMTLLVAGIDSEGTEVGETLALLMRDHPSRAVVLRVPPSAEVPLDARVFAQCWMPFGKRQQICCEQIELVAGEKGLADVSPVVRSLLVPDLPVALWCRSPQLLDMPDLEPILSLADKVIVDSGGVSELSQQIALIRRIAQPSRPVGDLAWTRLTRWRESIAQVFDNPVYLERLGAVREAHIDYEGSHLPISACYLAAWLCNSLRRRLHVGFRKIGECARARVHTCALLGEGIDVSIAVSRDRAAELHAGVRDTHMVFPPLSDYELLREELSLLARDPVYDAVIRSVPEFLQTAR